MEKVEWDLFVTLRKKLFTSELGQNNPQSYMQIPLKEAISFMLTSFSKQMPYTGSLALSYLYQANTRSMAELFGYKLTYIILVILC